MNTGCSDTTAQTAKKACYEYIEVVQRTVPQRCIVFEKYEMKSVMSHTP